MTEEVAPVAPVGRRDRRAAERRGAERRAGSTSRDLVPAPLPEEAAGEAARAAPAPPADPGAAVLAAQLMGQSGQRRGLRGGPPVLDAARAAYLETRYSGAADRRPRPGRTEDTDI
ncbi:hypothetical protein [Brevundimonas sp.]|uniref:hypothetical protein n=1 Tax=Brevundimonas sp. TaxID=1871086 RepID=UPI0035B49327